MTSNDTHQLAKGWHGRKAKTTCFGLDDLVYETVLERFVWGHEEVAIGIFLKYTATKAGMANKARDSDSANLLLPYSRPSYIRLLSSMSKVTTAYMTDQLDARPNPHISILGLHENCRLGQKMEIVGCGCE